MGEKLSVLIADDEDSLRTLVRAVLEADEQYIIDEASDGDEVLTKVHNDKPDILILDISDSLYNFSINIALHFYDTIRKFNETN